MIIHHSLRVKASAKDIYPMLLDWGGGAWWPGESRIRCTGPAEGPAVGSRFKCRMDGPYRFSWDVEVETAAVDREVSRRLTGALSGVERLYSIEGRAACEVHYLADFVVAGGLPGLFWRMGLGGRFDASVREALTALWRHFEGEDEGAKVDGHPAGSYEAERRRFLKGLIRR